MERNAGLTGITRTVHASCLNCGHVNTVTNRELNRAGRLLGHLAQGHGRGQIPRNVTAPTSPNLPAQPGRFLTGASPKGGGAMTGKPSRPAAPEAGEPHGENPSQNPTATALLARAGLAASMAEGRRLISQGTVKIVYPDGSAEALADQSATALQEGDTIQAGRRKARLG